MIEHKCDENKNIVESNNKYMYEREIVWRNVISLTLLHVGAIYGYSIALQPYIPWYGFFYVDLIGRIAAFGILAGSHRLWCHRSYKARLPLRIVLMIMQTMSLQNDIYEWCRDHRTHHKFSETDADPHNSKRGFFFAHMGWLLVRKHPEVIRKGKTIDMSDVWADPVVRFQRVYYIPLVLIFWLIVPTYSAYYFFELPVLECFFGTVVFRYVYSLHCAWLVNSAAHMYGSNYYDKEIGPRENKFVIYASMGEGYHNYHHAFPWDYSASEHSWKFCHNPATAFIEFCAYIGLAYDLRKPDHNLIQTRIDRTGDHAKHQQFVNHFNSYLDLILGFIATNALTFITLFLRYLLNGNV